MSAIPSPSGPFVPSAEDWSALKDRLLGGAGAMQAEANRVRPGAGGAAERARLAARRGGVLYAVEHMEATERGVFRTDAKAGTP